MKHNRTLRRGLSVLLSLVMCLSLLPAAALAETETSVAINETNFPDANFRSIVSGYDTDEDGTLSAEEIAAVTSISCSGKSISDLTGIEYFTALTVLKCYVNQLTTLDVSKNTALTYLDCSLNDLTTLDVSYNTALTTLSCSSNQLTTLDVSGNTALTTLFCYGNQLTTLDVSGNTALTNLDCSSNQLTTLNVSGNTALKVLSCFNNQLTTLTLGYIANLTQLYCSNNQLTSLDLRYTAVTTLDADGNTYAITAADGTFDLSTLPGSFELSKASNWQGGTVSENILTVNSDATQVTYTYDCGKEYTVTFTLKVAEEYTITFDANGGSGEMAAVTGVSGDYTLPACTFTAPEGKQFAGWATSATGEVITDATITVTENTTLYAIWEDIPATTCDQTADFTDDADAALALLNAAKTEGAQDSTWDPETKTLTLKGVDFATTAYIAVKLPHGAIIELAAGTTNTIASVPEGVGYSDGIYSDGDLTIQGSGALTATGSAAGEHSSGIYAMSWYNSDLQEYIGGSIEISDSAEVTATGGEAGYDSYGICAYDSVTISGGTVTATGGEAGYDSYGICTYSGDVTISGGTVTATGGEAGYYSYGIYASDGDMTISGEATRVTATGGAAEWSSFGIYTEYGDVTISGGTIEATGGEAGSGSVGISAGDDVTISGGAVTATGGTAVWYSDGIFACCDVDISGGAVTATGGEVAGEDTESFGIESYDNETITISGGHVIARTLAGADASRKEALNAEPDLTEYTGYVWRTGAEGAYTSSATTPYPYSADHTYVEFSSGSTATTYTVTVTTDGNGSAAATPAAAAAGTEITLTAAANSGYHFKEWQVVSGTVTIADNKFTMPDSDVTVKAIFEADAPTTYTITFDANGGSGSMDAVTVVSGSYTLPTCTFTAPEGKQFKGWATSANGEVISDISITVTDNITLYAVWEDLSEDTNTVTFNPNGGSGSMADVTVVSGDSYTLPSCTFTAPSGKQFKGWATSASGTVISDTSITVTGDTTLYAIWEDIPAATEYNITVTDGKATVGAGTEISRAAEGTTVILTANTAPDGKVFDKWVVESGSMTLADENSATTTFTMPASAVSVKATYKDAPHTHTFDQEIVKPEALKTAADCTHDAVYFKSCACGEAISTDDADTFTATDTALGHDWPTAGNWSKDADKHWYECSRCHEKKDEAVHDFGEDDICDTCDYDKSVPHTHNLSLVPATPATCTTPGNKAYYTCDGCDKWFEDATGSVEITDKTSVIIQAEGHTPSDWKSDADNHWKECTVVGCGVVIDGSTAAHTASDWITDTAATATTDGTKHKECTVCHRVLETGTIPATGGGEHTHSYGSEWESDADNHWHECSCGDKGDVAAHSFKWVVDKEATATQKGSRHEECEVCGYQRPAVEIPATGSTTEPTNPTESNPNNGALDDAPQTGDNSNMILWIVLLLVSGLGVTGTVVYSKRKKYVK